MNIQLAKPTKITCESLVDDYIQNHFNVPICVGAIQDAVRERSVQLKCGKNKGGYSYSNIERRFREIKASGKYNFAALITTRPGQYWRVRR